MKKTNLLKVIFSLLLVSQHSSKTSELVHCPWLRHTYEVNSQKIEAIILQAAQKAITEQLINKKGSNFENINLDNLSNINLSGTTLTGANFRKKNLAGANFSGSNLSGADFTEANLRGAIFTKADLRNANFTASNMKDVVMTGADLRGARFKTLLKHLLETGIELLWPVANIGIKLALDLSGAKALKKDIKIFKKQGVSKEKLESMIWVKE
ncbi:pentapeptide repeat-containing protein [Candidatus Dependentiae bacterium]